MSLQQETDAGLEKSPDRGQSICTKYSQKFYFHKNFVLETLFVDLRKKARCAQARITFSHAFINQRKGCLNIYYQINVTLKLR